MGRKIVEYEAHYLPLALADLEEIFQYVCTVLEAPAAAVDLCSEIDNAIHNFCRFPYAHRVYRTEKVLKNEYRKIDVKNFSVFYTVTGAIVEIHRIVYSKRDMDALLE
jgi:plasmid stabilization system protein ParE